MLYNLPVPFLCNMLESNMRVIWSRTTLATSIIFLIFPNVYLIVAHSLYLGTSNWFEYCLSLVLGVSEAFNLIHSYLGLLILKWKGKYFVNYLSVHICTMSYFFQSMRRIERGSLLTIYMLILPLIHNVPITSIKR